MTILTKWLNGNWLNRVLGFSLKFCHWVFSIQLTFAIWTLTFSIISCAHKTPPLTKDRLKPNLQKILPLNNRQILFTFSEELDTLGLKLENFTITSAEETLRILTLYPFSSSEIVAVTDQQSEEVYEAAGYVYDKEENKGVFKNSFIGSAKPDTISPWLTNYSKGAKNRSFNLQFNEAMDTTSFKFYILPKKEFMQTWQNCRVATVVPKTAADSLNFDTTYYLYTKDVRDISGNSPGNFITSVTPDTLYKPLILRGKVMVNDTFVTSGLAIIKRGYPIGISRVDKGEFVFEVRDSLEFLVEVVTEKYYGKAELAITKQDTVILTPQEVLLDSIID